MRGGVRGRALAGVVAVALVATVGALTGCGKAATQAVPSLDVGRYSGVDAHGAIADLAVTGMEVRLNGRRAWLPDPTTTGMFLLRAAGGYSEWHCTAAEQRRSLHCDVWQDPHAGPTPATEPCISPALGTPPWCAGPTHQEVDLLMICTNPGCS